MMRRRSMSSGAPIRPPGAARRERLFGALLFAAVFLFCDVGAAQLLKAVLPAWNFDARGVLERKYRMPSPLYHHDMKPLMDVTTIWGNIRYRSTTNSLGFRDRLVRHVPLVSARQRILFIGDSFTEGIGVPYDSSFVGRIARALEPSGIEVLNAAVAGYSPAMYFRKLKYWLQERGLQVSTIVVCLDISDVYNEARQYRLDKDERVAALTAPGPSTVERLKELVKRNSVLVRVLDAGKDALGGRKRYALDEDIARWTVDRKLFEDYGRAGLQQARENMDRLAGLARGLGVPMVLVVYPWPDQIEAADVSSLQVQYWDRWAAARGVAFISLFPDFIEEGDPRETIRRYFIPYDYHWNSAGHQRVAAGIQRAAVLPLAQHGPPRPQAVSRAGSP